MIRRLLFPQISPADLGGLAKVSLAGALLAGVYGVLHDQLTYSISPEYFQKLKFAQFHYVDFGWSDRSFVALIGFMASGAVGLVAGWFSGRRFLPGKAKSQAFRQVWHRFASVLMVASAFGGLGYFYGLSFLPSESPAWEGTLEELQVRDRSAFLRVATIHIATYSGAAIGLLLSLTRNPPPRLVGEASVTRSE